MSEFAKRGGWWKWDQIADMIADAKEAAWNEGARAATMDYGIGEATNPYCKEWTP